VLAACAAIAAAPRGRAAAGDLDPTYDDAHDQHLDGDERQHHDDGDPDHQRADHVDPVIASPSGAFL
jgi:hypothetical protein